MLVLLQQGSNQGKAVLVADGLDRTVRGRGRGFQISKAEQAGNEVLGYPAAVLCRTEPKAGEEETTRFVVATDTPLPCSRDGSAGLHTLAECVAGMAGLM